MNELVEVRKNQVVTSSRQVAEVFGKLHKDVLRGIRELTSAQNCAQWFYRSQYKDASGKMNLEYLMNRDGFSLLVMGFTGKKALEWKIKYIEAFNAMEKALNQKPVSALKEREIEARLNNSRARLASELRKIAEKTTVPEYKRICEQKAAEALTGIVGLLPAEEVKTGEKTYSATEIGGMLGVSATRIGIIANQNGMKSPQYGKYFYSKSEHSCKEVETFRYFECAIAKFRELLGGGDAA